MKTEQLVEQAQYYQTNNSVLHVCGNVARAVNKLLNYLQDPSALNSFSFILET